MTQQSGWSIVVRDLMLLQRGIFGKLVYLDPKKSEYYEAKVLYVGIDKVLTLIDDYEANRDKAMGLLNTLENPESSIVMDVDNA